MDGTSEHKLTPTEKLTPSGKNGAQVGGHTRTEGFSYGLS